MAHTKRMSLVSLLALGIAMPALAQTPADQSQTGATDPAAADRPARDVVVVTANKREESVQDIAVAITAVTSEQRQEQGIATITDLTNITPGLSYTAGNERVTLRGVGRNTNNFGAEPGVANYTDGVYQSFASIAGRDDIFVDRIEVLRGPQGTLYGRNSIGGALNIISKRPSDELEVEFRLAAGNFDYMKVGASVSGPITDWLRYRVVGYQEEREGIYDNFGTGEPEGYGVGNHNVEAQLEGDISDRWSWWAKYTTGGYHMSGPPGGRTGIGSNAPYRTGFTQGGGASVNGAWAFTNPSSLIGYTQLGNYQQVPWSQGIRAFNTGNRAWADLDDYDDVGLEMVYEFDNFDVKYTGGYIFYNYKLRGDVDGTPIQSMTYNAITGVFPVAPCAAVPNLVGFPTTELPPAAQGCITSAPLTINPDWTSLYNENRAFFSNEVNFISTHDGPLQWLAGIYAYQENFKQPIKTFLADEPLAGTRLAIAGAPGFYANPTRLLTMTNNSGVNNSYGVYAQGDWELTDTLKATVGLRYSYDLKDMQEEASVSCFIVCNAPVALGGFGTSTLNLVDITPFVRNGVAAGVTTPQPGVTSATIANPTGVTYDAASGIARRELGNSWDAVTGTAGLEWSPTPDTLLYGKYSRGYKTGGFNAADMAPLPMTNPEFVNSYEVGLKHEFLSTDLTTNLAAFFYDWQDVQTPLGVVNDLGLPTETRYTAFVNLPKVQNMGFEAEAVWRPIDNLNLGLTYSYLNTEIKDGGGAYTNSLTGVGESVDGNKMPVAPEHKLAANASYRFEFEDGSSLLPAVSWYWRDSFYANLFNNDLENTPDYAQTDARLIWNDKDGLMTVIGFVRNAFDEDGYDFLSAAIRPDGVFQSTTFTPPRMFGVEVQFHLR